MSATRVAVVGATGRMGATVCQAVEDADGLDLVARIDDGDDLAAELEAAQAEVAVDFTVPNATQANVETILGCGVHAVVGTTGWTDEALEAVEQQLAGATARGGEPLGAVIAPNFALSAVLAMSFARKAAALFESVEVIELHHPGKVDAPSGTAISTAQAIAQARREAGVASSPDATESDPHGSRGAKIDDVSVHAVRLRGLVAHEEVLLGNAGEQLTIRTDSFDRVSFMPGVLLAVRQVASRPGLTRGLEPLLDL